MRELAPRLVRPLSLALPSGGRLDGLQVDDARLLLALLSAAERRGAMCANRVEAVGVLELPGGIAGVELRDAERGGRFVAATDRVVNASGAWADGPPWRGDDRPPSLARRRGTHIVLASEKLPLDGTGVLVPVGCRPGVLVIPWLGRVLVGPTDDPHDGDPDRTRPRGEDVDRLLAAVNSFFGVALAPGDVAAAFTAVWPDLPRRATVRVDGRGIVTVSGGELASWRRIAERAVDRLLERGGPAAGGRTEEIPLAPRSNVTAPDGTRGHLTERYGPAAGEVLAFAAAVPRGGDPIVAGQPDLLAEAAYAARHEQARSVGDVLLRRTRLGLVAPSEACDPPVPLRVARTMAPELGWNERRIAEEASAWIREARSEGLVTAPTAVD
jgi:glycerol-3-phosphate dehydrogenase